MKYGAKGAKWAPTTNAGDADNKPTYGDVMEFEGLNTSEDSLSMASGSAYGDNMEKIYISEFASGDISIQAVSIAPEVYAAILGTDTDGENGLTYGTEDEQPLGAYGFYANKMDANKKKYYEVNFYPKVMGVPEGESSKTKEDNISLEYESLSLRILAASFKNAYKLKKRFDTESAAREYLDGLFAGTADWPVSDEA